MMTPRQAGDWATLGFARKRTEAADALGIAAMAAREKSEDVNRKLREWSDA
jgi:hypothetical protein